MNLQVSRQWMACLLFLAWGCAPTPKVPSECRAENEKTPLCQKLNEQLLKQARSSRPRAKREALLALAEWGDPSILPQLERMAINYGSVSDLLNEVASRLGEPARSKAIDAAIQGHLGADKVVEILPQVSPQEVTRVLESLLPRSKADSTLWLLSLARKENSEEYFLALSPTLERLAKVHPGQQVRMRAAELVYKHTGREVEAARQACPRSVELPRVDPGSNVVAQARVELKSGTILLAPVQSSQSSAEPWCAKTRERRRQKVGSVKARTRGDACFLAFHFGEFGGRVEVHDRAMERSYVMLGGEFNKSILGPYGFIDWGQELWVLEGLYHGALSQGSVIRIQEHDDGYYRAAERFYLDGDPLAYKVDDDGSLLILVQYGRLWNHLKQSCPRKVESGEEIDLVLVRLTRDGTQRAVE